MPTVNLVNDFGVMIYATGHLYYARLAYALAYTIKANNMDVPVCIVCDKETKGFFERRRNVINHLTSIDETLLYSPSGKRMDIRAKMWANQISPYQRTLLLDADLIALPKLNIKNIFDSLKGEDFYIMHQDKAKYPSLESVYSGNKVWYWWCTPEDIKESYNFKKGFFYTFNGEFVYFEKTKNAEKFFDVARDVYNNCLIPDEKIKEFSGQKCNDEMAYNIACTLTGMYPKDRLIDNKPDFFVYWYWRMDENKQYKNLEKRVEMYDNFYFLSMAGKDNPDAMKQIYETTLGVALNSKIDVYGLSRRYLQKKDVLANRKEI